tara:strand:+ start:16206 stop:16601 length:396 start_codon:yes stop_codon:yes gene_type:complete
MRHFIAAVFAWALISEPVQADAIEDVIASQLDAFNARDTARAFSFASPMIKRLFLSPGNFGGMVARAYPMVWDNDFVRFLDRVERGDSVYQRLIISDDDGIVYILEYKMIETPQGWQIDGVSVLPSPNVGT